MRRLKGLLAAAALVAGACLAVASPAAAGTITRAQLAGSWTVSLVGNTGCGLTSMYVTFTLNGSGVGLAKIQMHSAGCADGTTSGNKFTIQSVNSTGQGTAGLTCGDGCGWTFKIQVDSGLRLFSLVDVEPLNPNNFLQGVAIHS
jgi:hypothetical protein